MTRENWPQPPSLFLDFDGTVTERDATDVLLEAFADSRWLDIESDWQAGRIGSRECLRAQMALMRASVEEVHTVLDSISVDRSFITLLNTCANLHIPVHIISDGFDYCIERILRRSGTKVGRAIDAVQIFSSHLIPVAGGWQVEFPFFPEGCLHGCATCKPAVMRQLNRTRARTIFVGYGLSDRYAAEAADVVFAKDKLAKYCDQQNLSYLLYEDLGRVAVYVESLLRAETVGADLAAEGVEA